MLKDKSFAFLIKYLSYLSTIQILKWKQKILQKIFFELFYQEAHNLFHINDKASSQILLRITSVRKNIDLYFGF